MFTESKFKAMATEYENAKTNNNPATRAAYAAFLKECRAQLKQIPVKVVFTEIDPYLKSRDLFNDIERGEYRVFTGGKKHPLISKRANAIFRAVHDFWGHYKSGGNFQPAGEFKAWLKHSQMFSDKARAALNTETIFQVAVYFYGNKPRQFAEQKAVILGAI